MSFFGATWPLAASVVQAVIIVLLMVIAQFNVLRMFLIFDRQMSGLLNLVQL